jgi:flagellar biosynthetic protein FliQ
MSTEIAIELLKGLMFQAVALAAPILLTGMIIGLAVSLFQAVTSISEATLSFVPKTLGIIVVLVLLLPWMLRTMISFSTAVIEKMPLMAR